MSKLDIHEFGKTRRKVSIVGLGGEGILRTHGRGQEARKVILEAVQQGITYFDSARVYAGSESYYGSIWPEHPDIRSGIFQTSKSARRDQKGALADLETTLRTMGLDHLDLWQVHDVRTEGDFEAISGPGGALEAFAAAKKAGKVRFIGVTGHHDPAILTRAVREWPVDSVLLPVNPVEAALGGFLDNTLAEARQKGVATIGMKVLGAGHYVMPDLGVTAELLIRFALSQNPTVTIVGCSTPEEVQTLSRLGRNFQPLSKEEQEELIGKFRPYAARLAYYRGTL
ncbi:MAG: aldo/keto reductase [Syntrophaceae bacterium]|nr:aldo/keto reductase [Syntrophaceae bacterium]